MRFRYEITKTILHLLLNSNFRYILFKCLGYNKFFSLILKSSQIQGNQNAQKNILYVKRSLFDKDIEQLSYRVRKFGWIGLPIPQITIYQEKLIPKKYRVQMKYSKSKDQLKNQWEECIKRSKNLLIRFQKKRNICALMLGNMDYWQDYSLQIACKELGIPVLVLHKEYLQTKSGHSQNLKNHFENFIPNFDALMVFGQRMKDAFVQLKNFDKDKIYVTGAARIDRWRSIEVSNEKSYDLLIISFRLLTDDWPGTLFLEMLLSVSNFFEKEKLGNILVKSKNKDDDLKIKAYCKKNRLDNIKVVLDENIFDLVINSKAVIGLNSLAVVECLYSRTPIFIPDWFLKNKKQNMFNSEDKNALNSVNLCENLDSLLANIKKVFLNKNYNVSDEILNSRKNFLINFWDYDPNISASKKIQDVIEKFISE